MFSASVISGTPITFASQPCAYFLGETAEVAAGKAEKKAQDFRKTNSGITYTVLVGEVTKQVQQPKFDVVLEDFKG